MTDTIFAVSSGRPPAAIAVLRISGPSAAAAALQLAGSLPQPRCATLRALRNAAGEVIDRALLLWFPGGNSATGEDLLEIHAHGGRAVIHAIEHELAVLPTTRPAEAGEFTRRALQNGRIDLAQAEGLAELLAAETEAQRRQAMMASEGALSAAIRAWMATLSRIAAIVEVAIDYDDEDDAQDPLPLVLPAIAAFCREIESALARPPIERLRDGLRVVLAGSRNAGKSSLFNALLEREAAIASPIAGTTRDIIEAAIIRQGTAMILIDTAGLTEASDDSIETIGIARAHAAIKRADILLWLDDAPAPAHPCAIALHSRADIPGRTGNSAGRMAVSINDPASVTALWGEIERQARPLLPFDDVVFNARQREALERVLRELSDVHDLELLLLAEHLRAAGSALAEILGVNATETMLDALFSQFCLGK